MRKCAIYCRTSIADDERTASIDSQSRACLERATPDGYGDADRYVERYTGADLSGREVLCSLRERVKSGEYDVVYVYAIDRLSRDLAHQAILFDAFKKHKCRIVSVTENIDDGSSGLILRAVLGAMAQVEREKILERTTRGRKEVLADGSIMASGHAKLGYRYEYDTDGRAKRNRRRVIDEEAAKVVRRVFDMVDAGHTINGICKQFTADGVPTPAKLKGMRRETAGRWEPSALRLILHDESYCGRAMRIGKTKAKDGESRNRNGSLTRVDLPQSEWVEAGGSTPPIISQDQFDRVQKRLRVDRRGRRQSQGNPTLCLGHIRCAQCGERMTVTQVSKRSSGEGYYRYYVCMRNVVAKYRDSERCPSRPISIHKVDDVVWERIGYLISRPNVVRRQAERFLKSQKPDHSKSDLNLHRNAASKLERRISNLVSQVADSDGPTAAKAFKQAIAAAEVELDRHKQAIRSIESRLRLPSKAVAIDQIDRMIGLLARRLRELPGGEKRKMIQALSAEVVACSLVKGEVDIDVRLFVKMQSSTARSP